MATAGLLLVLLLLSCWGQACSPAGGPRVRTILAAEKAFWVYPLPDGRRILFRPADRPPADAPSLMMLDVTTGQEVPISADLYWALFLDDELLYAQSGDRQHWYVINLRPLSLVRLEPLPGGIEALPGRAAEADSVYAKERGAEEYMLFLLKRDISGRVVSGYYCIAGVYDLDALLAGTSYKIVPVDNPFCRIDEKVLSPNGQYYYYVYGPDLQIYSQHGELLNTISGKHLRCYGWAWDSSGVYVQERLFTWISADVGPLLLLLAEPEQK